MLRRTSLAISIAVTLLGARPSHALAQETMEQRRAGVPFREGLALAAAGKNEEARVAFAQAYAAYPSSNILFNLAKAEALSGHTLEALRHFKQVAKDPKGTPESTRMSKEQIVALDKSVGHLRLDAPAGATITVDDDTIPERAPLSDVVDVAPGTHRIRAELGDKRANGSFDAAAGQTAAVYLAWPGAAPVATQPPPPLPPHDAPAPHQPETPARTVYWPPPTVSIALGAVTVISAAVAVGFAVDASGKNDQVSSAPAGVCANPGTAPCKAVQDNIDARSRDRTATVVFGGLGGLALVVGAAWWVMLPRTKMETVGVSHQIAPRVSAHGAGLTWQGTF